MNEHVRPKGGLDPAARDLSRGTSSRPGVRLSGTELSDFFFNIPATVWTTDPHLVLTFVHGAYLNRLQIDPNKIVGRTIQDILLDGREDHPLIQGHLSALSGHETTVRVEWGGRLYTARIAPLRGQDDGIIGCVGVHLEIGWMPDDEGTLRESDVRLRRVMDSNPMGIAFGNDSGSITEANDAFLQLIGYAREDLVLDEISWPALMPVETHQRQIQALKEIQTTGRCAPFEIEIVRKDGARVPVLLTAVRLSARRREGVAFVLDISEPKRRIRRLEAELAAADALGDALNADEAARRLQDLFVGALEWRSALLATAADGLSQGGPAAEALISGREVWLPDQNTLVLPIGSRDQWEGVLILIDRPTAPPDPDRLAVSRRIAQRLGRFLQRLAR